MRLPFILTAAGILLGAYGCAIMDEDLCLVDEDREDPILDLVWDSDRIELTYHPDALTYWFPGESSQSLLTEEEKQQVRAMTKGVIRDRERIIQFFDACTMMDYIDEGGGVLPYRNYTTLDCYRGDRLQISFKYIRPNILIDNDGRYNCFPYDSIRSPDRTPEMWPFVARANCAHNLMGLGRDLRLLKTEPSPSEWCDAVATAFQAMDYTASAAPRLRFQCPSPSLSHYAMNAGCKPDSPPDTVFLFETEPGWNVHGGAELFTLENHAPRGGCVLLKGGKVLFVRSQTELARLRWK